MHQITRFWPQKLKNLPILGGGTPPSQTLPPLGSFAPSHLSLFHSMPPPMRWPTVRHCTAQPISIISNHKFITPPSISTLRDFSLSQNRHPILVQPNFQTLYKSGQCSPKHKLFSNLLVSYDRWDIQPHMHMFFSFSNFLKIFQNFYLAGYSKVSMFFDTRYMLSHY